MRNCAYPGTGRKVLEDVTLELPAGKVIAIVGVLTEAILNPHDNAKSLPIGISRPYLEYVIWRTDKIRVVFYELTEDPRRSLQSESMGNIASGSDK